MPGKDDNVLCDFGSARSIVCATARAFCEMCTVFAHREHCYRTTWENKADVIYCGRSVNSEKYQRYIATGNSKMGCLVAKGPW